MFTSTVNLRGGVLRLICFLRQRGGCSSGHAERVAGLPGGGSHLLLQLQVLFLEVFVRSGRCVCVCRVSVVSRDCSPVYVQKHLESRGYRWGVSECSGHVDITFDIRCPSSPEELF